MLQDSCNWTVFLSFHVGWKRLVSADMLINKEGNLKYMQMPVSNIAIVLYEGLLLIEYSEAYSNLIIPYTQALPNKICAQITSFFYLRLYVNTVIKLHIPQGNYSVPLITNLFQDLLYCGIRSNRSDTWEYSISLPAVYFRITIL